MSNPHVEYTHTPMQPAEAPLVPGGTVTAAGRVDAYQLTTDADGAPLGVAHVGSCRWQVGDPPTEDISRQQNE